MEESSIEQNSKEDSFNNTSFLYKNEENQGKQGKAREEGHDADKDSWTRQTGETKEEQEKKQEKEVSQEMEKKKRMYDKSEANFVTEEEHGQDDKLMQNFVKTDDTDGTSRTR